MHDEQDHLIQRRCAREALGSSPLIMVWDEGSSTQATLALTAVCSCRCVALSPCVLLAMRAALAARRSRAQRWRIRRCRMRPLLRQRLSAQCLVTGDTKNELAACKTLGL